MYREKYVTAILLAGGSGSRFGASGNKVYVRACGKPILQYSLEVLAANALVDELVLVVKDGEQEMAEDLIRAAGGSLVSVHRESEAEKPGLAMACELTDGKADGGMQNWQISGKAAHIVTGGASRQESVLCGLLASSGDIVIIHDGARPMILDSYVTRCIETMDHFPGATIAVHSKDTIKLSDENGLVTQTTVRANTWNVQTPQCFRRNILLAAHEKYGRAPGITDDCSLLELAGQPVKLLEGDYTNIKVTTAEDLWLAEAFLRELGI